MIALHAKKKEAIAAMLYCMSIRCILNAAIPKKKPAKGNDKMDLLDAAMDTAHPMPCLNVTAGAAS